MINVDLKNREEADEVKFYRIGEAAKELEVSIPTLRMYEREGLVLPMRRGSMHRRFSENDLERIRYIRNLINVEKVSIEGIKHLFALIPCWKMKSCTEEMKITCTAFNQHDEPCWMVMPKSMKCSNAECRYCPVYMNIGDSKSLKQLIAGYTATPVFEFESIPGE